MVDAVDEDHSGMRPALGSPLPQNRREVFDVVGDENAILLGRQREYFFVRESLVRGLLGQASNVVSFPGERTTHPARGDMGVEQEAHPVSRRS